ncbi:malto-oligosyltrehalose synthase [Rhizobium helianthi]|uniref:Malto-oligosyltrehalose synthase n=1 Tax=Rhizobium helianthi TaxID=1132695 RepID=A0ABW4M2K2_9HYPH
MTIPTSTYRIQFRNGMTFDKAAELVPYLNSMGISHLYASPIFTAAKGSTHGYDVADANEIEPELGGREGFDRLSTQLKQEGLGLILDIVPNHMASGLENRWWRSIVEWGKDSRYHHFFDVNWMRRLTLPFLGDDFDKVLADGDITLLLDTEAGCLAFGYFESHYPLSPATYAMALGSIEHPLADQLIALARDARAEAEEDFHDRVRELARQHDMDAFNRELAQAAHGPGLMSSLHEAQPYRLMSWRDAPRDLSYRRFFEITGLAGLRVEEEEVFLESHRLILDLVRSGQVDGLRIDHVDGLANPGDYLARLREEVGPKCILLVEKILAHGEHLPQKWPISGTTGYEFIATVSDALIEPEGLEQLRHTYAELAGREIDIEEEVRKAKGLMADVNFEGEFSTLAMMGQEMAQGHGMVTASDAETFARALRELLIAFPVYRTYGNKLGLEPADRQRLTDILTQIRSKPTAPDAEALSFIARILAGDVNQEFDAKAAVFRTRFQQLTGPLMAKSIEDTLFYRINPAIALNEVGAEPLPRSFSLQNFHADMKQRQALQPEGLSASSTHDTKRGEDARARLYTVTEEPELFSQAFAEWQTMQKPALVDLNDGPAPEPEVEWLILQALAGVWPHNLGAGEAEALKALEERLLPYVEKSLREAKLRTNWNGPNEGYEKAVGAYIRHLLSPEALPFREHFLRVMKPVFMAGAVNSITQTLIKLTAPGVPDIYQGSETMDLSLVDPDNRRMPDYARLTRLLNEPADPATPETWLNGHLKQQIIKALLHVRRENPDLFWHGEYIPLYAAGEKGSHVVAFARRLGKQSLVTIAPRFVLETIRETGGLPQASFWYGTSLTTRELTGTTPFRNLFTGETVERDERVSMEKLFSRQPFAVLLST